MDESRLFLTKLKAMGEVEDHQQIVHNFFTSNAKFELNVSSTSKKAAVDHRNFIPARQEILNLIRFNDLAHSTIIRHV